MSARRAALGLAGGFAVLMPLVLLLPPNAPEKAEGAVQPPAPLATPAAPPPLSAVYERPLFGAAAEAEAPADAPALVGIVGRLGADAVALVRSADGTTRALQVGESVDGWQLASLAIDAAFFTRGAQRVRVPLPAG
ncbi:hypothetical protein MZO42_00210 [Sphingomonas psychrotolerans]|uniref:Type II secretion system protein GspC N-terminal domain-containing protein n=1 Tax=Sphingomonas psychrotolerans TaxID=1327635 RepID=A0ABU3MXS5_9SPHN|nr:hypothetical protein [Sphingomonas psychrotolerans]MDT8757108.1 hypothetical protein [Sphingomonas psychrotolerans]